MGGATREPGSSPANALRPLEPSSRLYGTATFTWMMFSMNVCIPLFVLGTVGLQLGLSPAEVVLGAILGNLATTVVLVLNGIPGVKLGIPYPVQLRASWGYRGASIPVVLRGIVGAGWYGIEAYSASLAVLMLLLYALGYGGGDPAAMASAAFRYVVVVLVPYVVVATLAVMRGLRAIARVVDLSGPLLLAYFVWLTVYLSGQSPTAAAGGAGVLSRNFALYLAIQTNFWATVGLNAADLARGLYADRRGLRALVVGPLVGIVLTSAVASLLGYYLTLYTGLASPTPQEIVLYRAPGEVAVALGLVFAALAPFTTDITANIPALMNIFTSVLGVSWRAAAVAAGVVGFLVAPWWAVERGPDLINYVAAFTANYGLILGPIAGVMIADYYIVKRGYDLRKLYTNGPEGYWYRGGYNPAAVATFVLSVAVIYGVSYAIGDVNVVTVGGVGVPFPTTLSWYIGVAVAAAIYTALAKLLRTG